MGTTALSVLQTKLQTAIGDDKRVYFKRYDNAINNAIREIYPSLHRPLEDISLITNNILPPFNWTSTTALSFYTTANLTSITKTTDPQYFHNGPTSAKALASAADGYLYISSHDYPPLLDLMDKTINYKCWAQPQTALDAFLTIYTIQPDGTAQTLNSTTASYADKLDLIELEDQELNDDLFEIQFRMRVHTNAEYIYFDPPRATDLTVREYLLPTDFQNGRIAQVYIQTSGYSDDICDDLLPTSWERCWHWDVIDKAINGTLYKFLRLKESFTSERRIRLVGTTPLESLSATTDTISLDGEKVNLLIAYVAHLLYEMEMGVPSATDVSRLEKASAYWWGKYRSLLPRLSMTAPSGTMKIAPW